MNKKEFKNTLLDIKSDLEKIHFVSDVNNNTKTRIFNLNLKIDRILNNLLF